MNRLNDDEWRTLTTLTSNCQDPKASAARQAAVAKHEVETPTLMQRFGKPGCILDLQNAGIKCSNDGQHCQLNFSRSRSQQDSLTMTSGRESARTGHRLRGNKPGFAAARGVF